MSRKTYNNALTTLLRTLICGLSVIVAGSSFSQDIFNSSQLHEIRITTSQPEWFDSLQLYYDAALNGAAHRFEKCNVTIDGETVENAGLRFKGKYSNYGFPGKKKPFRLDFNEFTAGQSFHGLKKLNLHNLAGDPSFLREFMAYDLLRSIGAPAPRASFTRLYINDDYWGCYQVTEEPDKVFLQQRFGNKSGNLFDCVKTGSLSYKGDSAENYPELELKTDSSASSWQNVIEWIRLFNQDYDFDFQHQLSDRFNTEVFMRILAVDVLINNPDSYATNGRNYLLYDNPGSGKIEWIPWDYNLSFWADGLSPLPYVNASIFQPLIYRFAENEYLKKAYFTRFCHLLNEDFANYPFEEKSRQMFELIREAVEEDTLKFYTTGQFYVNRTKGVVITMLRNNLPQDVFLPGLTDLFAKRKTELRKNLAASGCDCDNPEEQDELNGVLFPNPANEKIMVYIDDDLGSLKANIAITNLQGQKVSELEMYDDAGSFQIDVSALRNGSYLLRLTAGDKTFTRKISKN